MHDQIQTAVMYLVSTLTSGFRSEDEREEFKRHLQDAMKSKFEDHWFPENPCKGQAYRCIRVNGHNRLDDLLGKAARAAGIKYSDLKLPMELTMWIDPDEVACRFGEGVGSNCTLAMFGAKEHDAESLGSDGGSVESDHQLEDQEVCLRKDFLFDDDTFVPMTLVIVRRGLIFTGFDLAPKIMFLIHVSS